MIHPAIIWINHIKYHNDLLYPISTPFKEYFVLTLDNPILKKQLAEFGRNFFFVREFKNQIDRFWNNSGEKYYLTIEDPDFEHKVGVYSKFQYASIIAIFVILIILVIYFIFKCRNKCKKRPKEEKTDNDNHESLLKAKERPRGTI